MKVLIPLFGSLGLIACAHTPQSAGDGDAAAVTPYGADGLPSAEVTAFNTVNARLKYRDARIQHDASGCAVYEGTDAGGQRKQERLVDAAGQLICVQR